MAIPRDDRESDIPLGELSLMFSRRDGFMNALGIEITDIGPGTATVCMCVGEDHLNFNGSCHGAAIFSLADTAFGVSANSHGVLAVGVDAHIVYQAAAYAGETLTARSREMSRSRNIGSYRIDVESDKNGLIATFTGTVYIIGKPHSIEVT